MKTVISLFILFLSSNIFANLNYGKLCSTHGECQLEYIVEYGTKCFIVKTGINSSGEITCTKRCYNLPLGSYCKKDLSQAIGVCKKEVFEVPTFNPNKPDCSQAIDPLQP